LTIFMITHDLREGFALGSRLWVFDKMRHDPQQPNRYGAHITYDIPLDKGVALPDAVQQITARPVPSMSYQELA
jgi:NitT/TauT family transport system ATP-binding protein